MSEASEGAWGKCEKCGQPAIHFLRDTCVTGCKLDSQGRPWVTREPGDLHQYCGGCLPVDKIGLVWSETEAACPFEEMAKLDAAVIEAADRTVGAWIVAIGEVGGPLLEDSLVKLSEALAARRQGRNA